MKLPEFIKAVDNLVWKWSGAEHGDSITPRAQLEAIYNDVCEQAVHRLAEAVQQRDEALKKLHKHYLEGER